MVTYAINSTSRVPCVVSGLDGSMGSGTRTYEKDQQNVPLVPS
jgi:hypothetical protein